jgi:hypothetical protein
VFPLALTLTKKMVASLLLALLGAAGDEVIGVAVVEEVRRDMME